ncbi:MAG: hypothetical protein LBG72_02110 [Spirochaetaceae bacterium]|jgi:hypothetical protein|nr:hypothetical protein [Spirochaetaceae bacterium]
MERRAQYPSTEDGCIYYFDKLRQRWYKLQEAEHIPQDVIEQINKKQLEEAKAAKQ